MSGTITDKQAAKAAHQLAYHRERMLWMEERMNENTAALEMYLMGCEAEGRQEATLPGGYRVERGEGGEVSVRRPEPGTEGFEQLRLLGG